MQLLSGTHYFRETSSTLSSFSAVSKPIITSTRPYRNMLQKLQRLHTRDFLSGSLGFVQLGFQLLHHSKLNIYKGLHHDVSGFFQKFSGGCLTLCRSSHRCRLLFAEIFTAFCRNCGENAFQKIAEGLQKIK